MKPYSSSDVVISWAPITGGLNPSRQLPSHARIGGSAVTWKISANSMGQCPTALEPCACSSCDPCLERHIELSTNNTTAGATRSHSSCCRLLRYEQTSDHRGGPCATSYNTPSLSTCTCFSIRSSLILCFFGFSHCPALV
jgi:hypothetical protein